MFILMPYTFPCLNYHYHQALLRDTEGDDASGEEVRSLSCCCCLVCLILSAMAQSSCSSGC